MIRPFGGDLLPRRGTGFKHAYARRERFSGIPAIRLCSRAQTIPADESHSRFEPRRAALSKHRLCGPRTFLPKVDIEIPNRHDTLIKCNQGSSWSYSKFDSLMCTALVLRNSRNEGNTGYYTLLPHHSHLAAAVGFTNLFPRFTVTRLCSATVEMSNPSCWFCCKLAVLSGSAAALVVLATALCAGTLFVALLLASLATGGAGAAA